MATQVLSALSSVQTIISSLDTAVKAKNRLKKTEKGYKETLDKLKILKAILDKLVTLAAESGRNMDDDARKVLEGLQKETNSLKEKIEADNSLQRLLSPGRFDGKLKSLHETVQSLCTLVHLQGIGRGDDATREHTAFLEVQNCELRRFIEEILENSMTPISATQQHLEEIVESSVTPTSVTQQHSVQAGPCLEDDYKRMFTECSQRIDNILAMDNLQEMTMLTTKEEYLLCMECVVPFGAIETPTSPITLPSTGGCSHAVPECIEAILSFVKGCTSSLSGAEEERHYYEMVRTHLVQLITHVLPEAISTSFKDRQLSVKEGIQLFLNACQLRDFPGSKYFKREVKDKYPLLIGNSLEWDLSCNDVQRWELLKHCAWTTINQAVFSEMKWEATFLRINWLPEDSTQAAQMDYLKPVDNYLKLLAAILEHPGLDDNLCEKHNCFTSLLFELDNCIVGMFSNNVVENFNIHAVTAINSNIQEIQRFAEDVDGSWFRSTDAYGLISSALSNARKWVDMLMSVEPQLLPERLSREGYHIFLKDAYELDVDSRTVISVCEKFVHSDHCRAMFYYNFFVV